MDQQVKKSSKKNIFVSILFVLIYALLLIVSVTTMLESSGIFRTAILVFILPATATLFYNKKRLTVILTFFIAFMLLSVESRSLMNSFCTALMAAAFAALGIFIKRLIVTAVVDKNTRKFSAISAAVLFVLGAAAYFFFFGNPVSAINARNKNTEYISSTYKDAAPEIAYTHYSFDEKKYFTKVAFKEDAVMSADIAVNSDGSVIDGYNNYYEYQYLTARRELLVMLLEIGFPNETQEVRCNIEETKIAGAALRDPDSLCEEMVFDIAFYDQINTPQEFVYKCGQYEKVIGENGFEYDKITYYGGIADEFVYEMTVEKDFDGELSTLVKDFSADDFERYYSEEDLYDHWSYND